MADQDHPILQLYRGFSTPEIPLDTEILDAVGAEHSRQVVRSFLDRFEDELRSSSDGLVDCLERWSLHDANLDAMWNTEFGMAERLPKLVDAQPDAPRDPVAYALRLAMAMAAAGHCAQFTAQTARPTRSRFERWALPSARSFTVDAAGDRLELSLTNGVERSARFARQSRDHDRAAAWRADGDEVHDVDELPHVMAGRVPVTFATPAVLEHFTDIDFAYPVTAVTTHTTDVWQQALDLLEAHQPAWRAWAARGARDLVPVAVPDGAMVSSSHTQHWGEIYMSVDVRPLQAAEMLVHEISHQHYFMGCLLSPVDDGSDTTLYYSPVKQRERPIDKILLAYHAFANVVLFYRRCRDHGLDTSAEEAAILPEVEDLERPLRETTALTDYGRALWQPLAERLADTASVPAMRAAS